MAWPLWRRTGDSSEIKHIIAVKHAILFLVEYSKEFKADIQTKTFKQMIITALFKSLKKWKQPKCPSADEQINKI